MIDIYCKVPTYIQFNKETDYNTFFCKMMDTDDSEKCDIFLNMKPIIEDIGDIESLYSKNTFGFIYGFTKDDIERVYKLGARTLTELLKINKNLYKLTPAQKIGCKYYEDLMKSINDKELSVWNLEVARSLYDLDCNIFSQKVEKTKEDMLHSKLDIKICLANDKLNKFYENFMNNMNEILMTYEFDIFLPMIKTDDESYIRIGCIGNLYRKYGKCVPNKTVLVDITVYSTKYFPLPEIRYQKSEWLEHNLLLNDTNVGINGGEVVKWRQYLNRDLPHSLEECIEIINTQFDEE